MTGCEFVMWLLRPFVRGVVTHHDLLLLDFGKHPLSLSNPAPHTKHLFPNPTQPPRSILSGEKKSRGYFRLPANLDLVREKENDRKVS